MATKRQRRRNASPASPNFVGETKVSKVSRADHQWRPIPVESIILAGIAIYVAIASSGNNPQQHQLSLLGDGTRDIFRISWPAALTAISSLISYGIIWSQQCHLPSPGQKQLGADPSGVSIGSTLVPLLFSSAVLFNEGCTAAADTLSNEVMIPSGNQTGPDYLKAYAFASSIAGLAFALGFLKWSKKRDSGSGRISYAAASTRTAAYIMLGLVSFFAAVNEISTELTLFASYDTQILAVATIGMQALLLYCYARPQTFGVCAAFTPGEWCCVSNLLSTLMVDFLFRYLQLPSLSIHRPILDSDDMHLAIAHSGLVGCILGCALASLVPSTRTLLWQCAIKVCIIIGVTILCVESVSVPLVEAHDEAFHFFMPSSLQWLISFLSTQEDVGLDHDEGGFISEVLPRLPRWIFLAYWTIILMVAAFPARWMASYLLKLPASANKHRLVVVSRKYFHGVAVFLFLPPTFTAPAMMALSYAIALCVLISVETLRRMVLLQDSHHDHSSVNDFYEAFLDEKDTSSASRTSRPSRGRQSGVFVVTHMAMIFGCALPLWVKKMICRSAEDCYSQNSPLLFLLPLIGIISLGVGDAAGAVVGVYAGRLRWPGTRRTVEGSLAMLLAMMQSVLVSLFYSPISSLKGTFTFREVIFLMGEISPLLAMLTLLEAFTSQIDNLCLPVAGSILFLLHCRQ